MPRPLARALAAAAAVAALAWFYWPGAESAIRARLDALADDVNASSGDAVAAPIRAARIATYFTDDVVIDLGQGTARIQGRDTLVAMLTRLEPRTHQFTLKFVDAAVDVQGTFAEVELTAEIDRQGATPRDSSMDAREFAVALRKLGNDWQILRVRSVETIR